MTIVDASRTVDLERLEARARRDLAAIEAPAPSWMRARFAPDGAKAFDVVIAGAGLSGATIAFGLRRQGLDNILLLDQRLW